MIPESIVKGVELLWKVPGSDLYVERSDNQFLVYSHRYSRNIAYYQTGYYQIENPFWAVGCSAIQWIDASGGRRPGNPPADEVAAVIDALAAVHRNDATDEQKLVIENFRQTHLFWEDLENGWKSQPADFESVLRMGVE